MVEGWTLVAIMVGGGFGAGYVTSQMQLEPTLVAREANHNAEISRLQDVYQSTLKTLGDRTIAAANAALGAATTADNAVASAEVAVTTATSANSASTRAVKDATEAVREAGKTMTGGSKRAIENTRRLDAMERKASASRNDINHSIDKANRALR